MCLEKIWRSIRSELIQKQAYLSRLGSNQEQQEQISNALKHIDNHLKKGASA